MPLPGTRAVVLTPGLLKLTRPTLPPMDMEGPDRDRLIRNFPKFFHQRICNPTSYLRRLFKHSVITGFGDLFVSQFSQLQHIKAGIMFCTHCGTSVTDTAFCSNCGKPANSAPAPTFSANGSPAQASNSLSLAGIVLGAIGFFVFPIVFATAGIVCALIARNKGEKNANTALIVSIVGLIGGMIFGAIVAASSML